MTRMKLMETTTVATERARSNGAEIGVDIDVVNAVDRLVKQDGTVRLTKLPMPSDVTDLFARQVQLEFLRLIGRQSFSVHADVMQNLLSPCRSLTRDELVAAESMAKFLHRNGPFLAYGRWVVVRWGGAPEMEVVELLGRTVEEVESRLEAFKERLMSDGDVFEVLHVTDVEQAAWSFIETQKEVQS